MHFTKKTILLLLSLAGGALADLTSECLPINKLLGQSDDYNCCENGYPNIKCSTDHITYVDLSNKGITTAIPTEIERLTEVKILLLNNNEIPGSIPSQIGSMTNLIELNLGENKLTGEIPISIGELKNLKILILEDNELTSVPSQITGLTLLTDLDLSSNKISGVVPDNINVMTNLRSLDLSNNSITGSIPPNIGSLTNLIKLDLGENALTGSIPSTIGSLTKLQKLKLGSNDFSGEIPTNELAKLTSLIKIELDENANLSGKIPSFKPTAESSEYVCEYSETKLCFSDSNEFLSSCELPSYTCNVCKENAQEVNGVCVCKDGYTGIGYISCVDNGTSGDINNDGNNNGNNDEKDGALASVPMKYILNALLVMISLVFLY